MSHHTEMTYEEARLIWNNLNSMSEEDFGGEYPVEIIEQACKSAVVLGLMYAKVVDGEVCYGLTEAGHNREPGSEA